MAALPPALNVFVFARQYDTWVEQASGAVLLGTLVSVVDADHGDVDGEDAARCRHFCSGNLMQPLAGLLVLDFTHAAAGAAGDA